jgi:phosphatidylinositol alpha-1,6-mannosyltransferase
MLALVTDAFGGRGGIAQYNRDFLGAVVSSGAVSSMTILPRLAPDRALPPDAIEQLPPRPGRIAYTLAALRTALSRSIGIVFCGHLYMAPLAALIARHAKARLIVQMHGIEAWPRPTRLQRAAVESADLVLCVSRYTRARVLSWAAIEPERVVVLPNTVGEAFTLGDASALRAKWGVEGKRVLLTVGRMDARERYKGHDLVIEALPQLVAAGHDVIYVVLGDGDDVPRLQSLAVNLGVADRVRFMGEVGLETLVDAYRIADLFVMPSAGEGFGIAFIEAMACGTPALGLSLCGARDALGNGELGVAISEAELPAAIMRLLVQPRPNSHALAVTVRARFGRAAFAANVCGVILRLLPVHLSSSLPAVAA